MNERREEDEGGVGRRQRVSGSMNKGRVEHWPSPGLKRFET